uniref:Uncharacterized protein n=1 Tax=Cajanus cajan TaxID=3821 RepID=A0A151TP20_CAJCA|nr:hypothetical protein KK1_022377 [Cajanus cajan]
MYNTNIINLKMLQGPLPNEFKKLEGTIFQVQGLKPISLQYKLVQTDCFHIHTLQR